MKKYFLILAFLILILSSCTQVNIISDPYWIELVSDFQSNADNLKIQSFINGYILKFYVSDTKGLLSDSTEIFKPNQKNIIILSPFMSTRLSLFQQNKNSIIYYFPNKAVKDVNAGLHTEIIIRDRKTAFLNTGSLLGTKLSSHSVLPIIYNQDRNLINYEIESFKDGIKTKVKDVSFIYLKVNEDTSEEDIRKFYDQIDKTGIKYIVVFSSKYKYLSYNLAEKYNLQLITADSWFSYNHRKLILYSIEDDVKGMLKKVYYNAKTGKHGEILLEGVIRKGYFND